MADFETLDDWTEDQQEQATATVATAKYSALSEALRRSVTEARLCSMFCGGKNCKYEGPASWSDDQRAIPGLYSHWITGNILAMARPNSQVIEKYDVIENFKKSGITAVINLQMSGEHSSCGPGLNQSGFTYDPQQLMDNDIFFYNYGWHDYSFGTMVGIVDVVRVMQFELLSKGKVAIHCHAGLGRTGVLIACYLVYTNRCDPDIAVHYIRRKRPGSVQTRSQIKVIREFAKFLWPSRIIFSSAKPKSSEFTLGQFLHRQKYAVHGSEARRLKYLPKIICVCCDRLLDLAGRSCHDEAHKSVLFQTSDRLPSSSTSLTQRSSTHGSSSQVAAAASRYENSKPTISVSGPAESRLRYLTPRPNVSYESFLPVAVHGRLSPLPPLTARQSSSSWHLPAVTTQQPWTARSYADDHISLPGLLTAAGHSAASPAEWVAMAMACTDYPPEALAKVDGYKQQLNTSPAEWKRLSGEDDPLVLSSLMWDWIDELKESVLCVQDLSLLLEHVNQPTVALSLLQKSVRQTISYIFYTVACLEPMSEELLESVIQRVLSTLLQQKMVTELDDINLSSSTQSYDQLLRRTANDGLMKPELARRVLAFFTRYHRELQENVCSCRSQKKSRSSQSKLSDEKEARVTGKQ